MNARVYDTVITIDVSVDTAAHAANDCVFGCIELAGVAQAGGCGIIQSVTVIDYDDQGSALDLVFFSESVNVGNQNGTFMPSDNGMEKCLGYISIGAADFLNLDQNQVATVTNCGLVVSPNPDDGDSDRSIWVAAQTTGTPTYAGGELRLRFGILRG